MLEHIRFGTDDIENKIASLSEQEIDELPFGGIEVDRNGKILRYNQAEADLVNSSKDAVIGKNFFKDVAPCTQTDDFYGRFQNGVDEGDLNIMFEWTFQPTGRGCDSLNGPMKVKVHMKKALMSDSYWIFTKRV